MTIYSETERRQREIKKQEWVSKVSLANLINDLNFLRPADVIITQKSREYQDTNKQNINRLLMGDIGIRNDSGINVIFHANEKRYSN